MRCIKSIIGREDEMRKLTRLFVVGYASMHKLNPLNIDDSFEYA
jgi:hypothetical protein